MKKMELKYHMMVMMVNGVFLIEREDPFQLLDVDRGHNGYCQATVPDYDSYQKVEGELIQVHTMLRHGDRSPLVILPQGYNNHSWECRSNLTLTTNLQRGCKDTTEYCFPSPLSSEFWSSDCTKGQLTNIGINQLYNLGKKVKRIYYKLGFLSLIWPRAKPNLMLKSTDVERTIQSGEAFLKGMFPNKVWSTSPFIVLPSEIETLNVNSETCPKLKNLTDTMRSSWEFKRFMMSNKPLRDRFEAVLGGTPYGKDPNTVLYYFDGFQTRFCHNLPLACHKQRPNDCIDRIISDAMYEVGNAENRIINRDHPLNTPLLHRLRIGGFLLELKYHLLAKLSRHSQYPYLTTPPPPSLTIPDFLIYSGHDTTFSSLFGALGSDNLKIPSYASSLLIELWYHPTNTTTSNPITITGRSNSNTTTTTTSTLNHYSLRFIYNSQPITFPTWCQPTTTSDTCSIPAFLNYLDHHLNLIGGWENYPTSSSKWNYGNECQL